MSTETKLQAAKLKKGMNVEGYGKLAKKEKGTGDTVCLYFASECLVCASNRIFTVIA